MRKPYRRRSLLEHDLIRHDVGSGVAVSYPLAGIVPALVLHASEVHLERGSDLALCKVWAACHIAPLLPVRRPVPRPVRLLLCCSSVVALGARAHV